MYQVDDLLRFAHHNYDIHSVAPNIELMFKNSMFDSITSNEPTYLAHVTTSLDKILKSGLYPSPGCLVGAVYCVPAIMDKNTNVLRMHNLGAFYYLEEFPSSNSGKDIDILIIKVNKSENYSPLLSGVNYLRMGDVHYNTYEKIKHAKTNGMKAVAQEAVRRIYDSREFLKKSVGEYVNTATENPKKFLVECEAASNNLPILSYLYFEAIYGFIMLHASDQYSLDLKNKGEMNNYYAKSFLFDLFPDLRSGKFRLSNTKPNIDELEKKLNALDVSTQLTTLHNW